jgi:cell division septum initiation protein DivIVA
MLNNTLEIVEKSLAQLQSDRDRLKQENEMLKKHLSAKDIDVNFE